MKAHRKALSFLLLTLFVTVVFSQKLNKPSQEADVNQFPILDYKNKATQQKGRTKYNSRHAPKVSESSDGIYSFSDWYVGLPALPTQKSAAVIVGEIIEAQAKLSEDETNIYSEFTVRVSQVLKNSSNVPLWFGNSILVERSGGRVRFPSGKVVVSRADKQDLPRIGSRYVLFLTSDEGNQEDFYILTGYELRQGKVYPLDKLSPRHPITAYSETSETSLFADLNRILTNPLTSQSR